MEGMRGDLRWDGDTVVRGGRGSLACADEGLRLTLG
jgi:hypothetical protein